MVSEQGKIKVLDPQVASQIAAGEVVERPASALKELIENSIDSGATEIAVDIWEGGTTKMSVVDNGSGIPSAELALTVHPHATSKIVRLADLNDIATLGFRGEALASISSLSNLTVRSRVKGSKEGSELVLHGKLAEEEPRACVMKEGTEIEVHQLFTHAPARRKFLRKPNTEWAHCETVLQTQALGNPQISFKLSRSGKKRAEFKAQKRDERVKAVMGKKFAAEAIELNHEAGPLRLSGFISLDAVASSSRQFLYLNNRAVKDKLINQAIRKACADVARKADFPYVLFLDVPGSLVDVNAHPAKTEVRFKESGAMFSFVYAAINNLTSEPLGRNPDIALGKLTPRHRKSGFGSDAVQEMLDRMRSHQAMEKQAGALSSPAASLSMAAMAEEAATWASKSQSSLRSQAASALSPPESLGKPIGMLQGIYLLTENEDGLVVIDIHAAHERLIYEQLKDDVEQLEKQPAQDLVESIELDLDPVQMDAVAGHREQLAQTGIHIRNENGIEFLVALPAFMASKTDDPLKLAMDCIEELTELDRTFSLEEFRNSILGTIACHSAKRGSNPFISSGDLSALVKEMEKTLRSGRCNHGRPVWRTLKFTELDKYFERGR